jgi:hypothetical protein
VLRLGSNNITGELPNFSAMKGLRIIDLSSNFLTGSIPNTLLQLPYLEFANLRDNIFTGCIPQKVEDPDQLEVLLEDNYFQCPLPSWQR